MSVRAWTGMVAIAFACLGAGCAADDAEKSGSTSAASEQTQLGNVMDMADAQQAIAQLSDQLDAELGQVGPGLTHDQQSAYVAQFAKDSAPAIKAAQDKYDAAADRISTYLKQRVPEVVAFAKNQAPASANGEELYSAFLVLAQTKHADESLRFMNSLAHDAGFAKLMAISDDFYDADHPRPADVVAKAVPYVVAKALSDHETPDQVVSALEGALAKSLSGEAITTYKGAFELIDLVRASRAKGEAHLQALMPASEIDKIGDKAIVKAVFGAGAALSLWSAKDALEQGDFTAFLESTAGAASDTLVIVGQLAESIHAFKPFAEKLVEVGERIGPGIDLVLSAVSTAQDVAAVLQNADPALKTKLFGDALTTIGAVIVFANPELGAIVMGVGAAVALVSEIVADRDAEAAARAAIQARTAKVIGGANADTIARALTQAEDNHLWDMSEYPTSWYAKKRLGMTAQQIQSIAARAPEFVRRGAHTDNGITGLQSLEAKCLVASTSSADLAHARDRLYGMLDAAIAASGDDGVQMLATSMNHGNVTIGDCAGWKSYLAEIAQSGAPDLAKAASAAKAYLASH